MFYNMKIVLYRSILLKQETSDLITLAIFYSKQKITLAAYEKIKEERRKALGVTKEERRVVQSSDFDGLVAVVAKKDLEEESLSVMHVNKPVCYSFITLWQQ